MNGLVAMLLITLLYGGYTAMWAGLFDERPLLCGAGIVALLGAGLALVLLV